MNNFPNRIEQILILAFHLAVLFLLRQTFKESIKKLRKQVKRRLPRKLKPRSPKDCPDCQSGVKLAVLKPKTGVIPYDQRKSTRGRTKQLNTQGHACPNPRCEYFGVIDHLLHAIVGDGKRGIDKNIQYWKCQWCKTRFTSRLHTPLYRMKTDEGNIVLVLMLLAEGCDISVLVRCSRHSEATITRWLERAGKHSSVIHDRIFRDLLLVLVQLDELYCRVRRTGKLWLWLAIDPITKILPSLHLGNRKNDDAMTLTHDLKLRLKPDCIPAFTTDGLRGYFYAITAHFGHWFRPEHARTDHWQVSDDLLYGQLVKQRKSRKSGFAIMRMLWGKRKDLNLLLKLYGFAQLIQTAFIERVNLTIRRGVAPLMRKTWSLAQNPEHLLLHVEWWRSYYHFIRPHESLSILIPGLHKYRQRSPAQAANLTSKLWTVEDVLKLPLIPVPT
jgi:IS1 family transposase